MPMDAVNSVKPGSDVQMEPIPSPTTASSSNTAPEVIEKRLGRCNLQKGT